MEYYYELNKLELGGWELIINRSAPRYFKKKIDALDTIQWLGLHLKPEDKQFAA